MTKLKIAATTEMGCHIYTEITVSEDYTMSEVVREVKRLRYTSFRLIDTMKTYVRA